MTDEVKDIVVDPQEQAPEQQGSQQGDQQIALSPVEQEAIVQGWVPKEEFEGDQDRWVDAAEFIRRGELFRKIDSQSREIKDVRKTLAALKEHYTKVQETEYNRALKALKAEKISAQTDGEFDKADLLADEIKQVEEQAAILKQEALEPVQENSVHPDVIAWIDRNVWYKTNVRMKAVADAIGAELASKGIQGPSLLKGIDAEIRREFPSKFTNPNRDKPGSVETGTTRSSSKKDTFQLSEMETKIMNTLVRDKVMTKEEYISDLKKVKGV